MCCTLNLQHPLKRSLPPPEINQQTQCMEKETKLEEGNKRFMLTGIPPAPWQHISSYITKMGKHTPFRWFISAHELGSFTGH